MTVEFCSLDVVVFLVYLLSSGPHTSVPTHGDGDSSFSQVESMIHRSSHPLKCQCGLSSIIEITRSFFLTYIIPLYLRYLGKIKKRRVCF